MATTKAKTASRNGDAAPQEAEGILGLEIPRPVRKKAILHLKGVSPLIAHRWSEKALKQLEDSQTGKAKAQKTARSPEEEFRAAAYVVPGKEDQPDGTEGKYYFPASAFKHAFLYGVAQLGDMRKFPKTKVTAWAFIDSDPILKFSEVVMRTDTGRVSNGKPHMIYRPQFNDWSVDLHITYNSTALSLDQLVALFDLGGDGGVGEWRPTSPQNKTGDYGRFEVETYSDLAAEAERRRKRG